MGQLAQRLIRIIKGINNKEIIFNKIKRIKL